MEAGTGPLFFLSRPLPPNTRHGHTTLSEWLVAGSLSHTFSQDVLSIYHIPATMQHRKNVGQELEQVPTAEHREAAWTSQTPELSEKHSTPLLGQALYSVCFSSLPHPARPNLSSPFNKGLWVINEGTIWHTELNAATCRSSHSQYPGAKSANSSDCLGLNPGSNIYWLCDLR